MRISNKVNLTIQIQECNLLLNVPDNLIRRCNIILRRFTWYVLWG